MARFLTSDTFAFYLNPAKEGGKKKKQLEKCNSRQRPKQPLSLSDR